jgi:iron complex outermembrane receptor protein
MPVGEDHDDDRGQDQRREISIAEALRTVPGLRVQQAGSPGAFTRIQTRGLRDTDTAILIDGLRLRDASTAQGDATSLIEELFVVNPDRIEILRGSGSSLYGSNAIGGVINIVSDQGGEPTHGELQFEGGQLGMYRGRGQLSGGFGDNRLVYSGGLAFQSRAFMGSRSPATQHTARRTTLRGP